MVFPTKKDIEDAIESLGIHVDACAGYHVPMTAKRVGGLIAMAESSKIISKEDASFYHKESNKSIKNFFDKCNCIHIN